MSTLALFDLLLWFPGLGVADQSTTAKIASGQVPWIADFHVGILLDAAGCGEELLVFSGAEGFGGGCRGVFWYVVSV